LAARSVSRAKVVSVNNFPSSTGLSSSSSGFAALTVAASSAAGLKLSQKELSVLARQGSGSACRSIPDGFTEWLDGETDTTSYAVSIAPPEHWDIVDLVVVVSSEKKDVPTSQGQKRVSTSPFFRMRLEHMGKKIEKCKAFIKDKDFIRFGELIEEEALELHAIMLTSRPALIYWLPATVSLMKSVIKWRHEGLAVYFTVNTGQDVHVICLSKDADEVMKRLEKVQEIKRVIYNNPSPGTRLVETHLF
jgi:diphosphomevalonate decarboxylase